MPSPPQSSVDLLNLESERPSIRILHIITTLGRGGAERQLVNLVSNTDRRRFEHTVAFLREPGDFSADIKALGYRTVCLDANGKMQWVQAAKKIRQLIKTERPTLLHSWLYDANISTRLAASFSPEIPVVVSLQNADYEQATLVAADLPALKVELLKYIDRISSLWIRPVFVACSEFVRQSAGEHLKIPRSDIEVIYNSVDPKGVRATASKISALRKSLGIPAGAFVFLNIGRLDPQKGQAVLIDAFHKVVPQIPNVFLLIVGQGGLTEDLFELAKRLGISQRVLFLGKRDDVGDCLSLADVFVFPSLFEGLPLALIEAMSKGLPCIVSAIDTLREVVDEDSSVLVPPGSIEELANAMLELYTNPAKRNLIGNQSQRCVKNKFLIGATIRQWEQLYSRVTRGETEENQ